VKPEYHAPFWILKARAHAQQAQADEAIDSYLKAVGLKPQDSGLKQELADLYIAAEKYQQGIDLYSEVLKGGDKPVDQAFFDMAQGFNLQGKADLAGLLFHKVLEVNPDYAEAYYELGIYYFYEKKDRGQAKQMLDRYLEAGQDNSHKDTVRAILTVMEKTR
ncbi:MAG: tetratricopeptide repeat protein, partial [Acidobacteriota bacterium]